MRLDTIRSSRPAGLLGAATRDAMLAGDPEGPAAAPPLVPAGHVPILRYHYIRLKPNPRDGLGFRLSVTPVEFKRQMRWAYEHGFHTVSLADLHGALSTGSQLDSHSFVLTFDD